MMKLVLQKNYQLYFSNLSGMYNDLFSKNMLLIIFNYIQFIKI